MQTQAIQLDRKEALELYRQYKKHQHYSEPLDDEIRRAYQLIAQGRMVIRALESIRIAGLGADKLPALAIIRADQPKCFLYPRSDGSATMRMTNRYIRRENEAFGKSFDFAPGTFPGIASGRWACEALTPMVPLHLRPKRGLENYHILWEAEWTKIVPVDPMLLRRIGKGDMWLVVAAWDLTEVERAALATRLSA